MSVPSRLVWYIMHYALCPCQVLSLRSADVITYRAEEELIRKVVRRVVPYQIERIIWPKWLARDWGMRHSHLSLVLFRSNRRQYGLYRLWRGQTTAWLCWGSGAGLSLYRWFVNQLYQRSMGSGGSHLRIKSAWIAVGISRNGPVVYRLVMIDLYVTENTMPTELMNNEDDMIQAKKTWPPFTAVKLFQVQHLEPSLY